MEMNIKTVDIKSEDYPYLLKETACPPKKLFIRGEMPKSASPKIGIVGTRKASSLGKQIAENISRELSASGIIIVSGLAMGIDTAAHTGAINGGTETVAVLGNGIDKIYPAQNENLGRKIIEDGGAVISEYGPGEPSYKNYFIQRNRIISGLSDAIVVIEAPEKSGALSTARFAAEQGRTVFVIPGPVNHPNYVGSHALIRDGAILVTGATDIMEDLGIKNTNTLPFLEKNSKNLSNELNKMKEEERLLIETIKNSGEPLCVDKLIELAKLDSQIVNQTIAFLVIKGILKETGGKYSL
jgi:DNA processing protein